MRQRGDFAGIGGGSKKDNRSSGGPKDGDVDKKTGNIYNAELKQWLPKSIYFKLQLKTQIRQDHYENDSYHQTMQLGTTAGTVFVIGSVLFLTDTEFLFGLWEEGQTINPYRSFSYKDLQTVTRSYKNEIDAFFKSEGESPISKEALEAYKENIERYLDGRGTTPKGNRLPPLTREVRDFQLNRLKLIEEALKRFQ